MSKEPEEYGADDFEACEFEPQYRPPQLTFPRKALAFLSGMIVFATLIYAYFTLFG